MINSGVKFYTEVDSPRTIGTLGFTKTLSISTFFLTNHARINRYIDGENFKNLL